jgi:hypothetical protein
MDLSGLFDGRLALNGGALLAPRDKGTNMVEAG